MISTGTRTIISTIMLLLIIGAGAALRHSFNEETFFFAPVRGDAADNLRYAENLLEHGTYSRDPSKPPVPDAYGAPGYPVFLAAVIGLAERVDADAYDLILLTQVVLGAATILFCFLLARRFLPGYWPLLPSVLVAFSPHLVSLASYALSETLFGVLLLLSLLLLARALDAPASVGRWLGAGTGFAATVMVNPAAAVVPPGVVLALWAKGRFHKERNGANGWSAQKSIILLLSPMLLVAGLWAIRGALSVPDGSAIFSGRLSNELTAGLYHPEDSLQETDRSQHLDENSGTDIPGGSADHGTEIDEVVDRVATDPMGVLYWYGIGKPVQLWRWNLPTSDGDIYVYEVLYSLYHTSPLALTSYSIMHSLHYWLIACCALGLIYVMRDRSQRVEVPLFIYTSLITISLVYIILQAEARYSVPLRPELYLGASFFLWCASQTLNRLRLQSRLRAGATVP